MTLRLGLLVDSSSVAAWVAQLADRVSALNGVEITLLIDAGRSAADRPAILDAYLNLERRFLHNIPDLTFSVNLHEKFPNTRIVSVEGLEEDELEQLDIVISFQADSTYLPARLGTWSWNDISATVGFREVLDRTPLTTCAMFARLPNGRRMHIRSAVIATDWFSAARNQNLVYLRASSILIWALKKLILQGEDEFFKLTEPQDQSILRSDINNSYEVKILSVAKLAWKQAGRALEKKLRPRETWLLFAGQSRGGLVPARTATNPIVPPRGVYWADPMAVERDGRTFLFVEEYVRATRRGRIVCLTLDEEAHIVSTKVVLERPYRLSSPFTFQYHGETYMIPETASKRAIELYRCTHWPDAWEFIGPVMKDLYAVDTTLLQHGRHWWLFANLMTESGSSSWDELHLFFSDDPLSSNWTPHPLNPIVSDARSARPAGPFFTHNGILYRPSQDSSRRYGYALNLNRVDILTERDYAETLVEKILPQAGYLATHTYSRTGNWIFMDSVTRKMDEAG